MSDKPTLSWSNCEHEWQEKIDSQFSSELFTDVVCKKCGCPGQRNESTQEVYWPAT